MRSACPLRAGDHLSDRRSHDSAQPSAAANGAERTTLQDQEHTQTELSVSHRTSRACGACLCDMCTRGAVVSEHARGAVHRSSLADGGGLSIQRNQMTHIPDFRTPLCARETLLSLRPYIRCPIHAIDSGSSSSPPRRQRRGSRFVGPASNMMGRCAARSCTLMLLLRSYSLQLLRSCSSSCSHPLRRLLLLAPVVSSSRRAASLAPRP